MRTLAIQIFLFFLVFRLSAQTDTLRLIFAGDVMGHGPQIRSAELVPNEVYDFNPCFKYVKPIVGKADVAFANLEVTLPGAPPYKGYPTFRSPDALGEALKNAGFDVLFTANNHSNDSRGAGVIQTIETLRDQEFVQTGTFKDANERAAFYPLMFYQNGFKLAILNYTYGTNGIPTEPPTVVNLIDTAQIRRDLEECEARKPHFTIVMMHWGLEYQLNENAQQRDLARFIIRHGADMIIGAHPHVVQPVRWESVELPDGQTKEALVVYSLGNYISNQRQEHTDGGVMFQVDLLHRAGVPYAEYGHHGLIPVFRYIHRPPNAKPEYYIIPTDLWESDPDAYPKMSQTSKDALLRFANGLKKRLAESPFWGTF